MNRSIFYLLGLFLICTACSNNQPAANAEAIDTGAYQLEAVPGSNCEKATIADANGFITETGFICNGAKNGTWATYSPEREGNQPVKVISYVDGVYNGTYMEINDRGQIELLANYKNNKLHGAWGKYRFGRPEITANYIDGVLNGVYKEFEFRDGTIKKEVSFKNGKEDGIMRHYDEHGRPILEYVFENGEKVSQQTIVQEAITEDK